MTVKKTKDYRYRKSWDKLTDCCRQRCTWCWWCARNLAVKPA